MLKISFELSFGVDSLSDCSVLYCLHSKVNPYITTCSRWITPQKTHSIQHKVMSAGIFSLKTLDWFGRHLTAKCLERLTLWCLCINTSVVWQPCVIFLHEYYMCGEARVWNWLLLFSSPVIHHQSYATEMERCTAVWPLQEVNHQGWKMW